MLQELNCYVEQYWTALTGVPLAKLEAISKKIDRNCGLSINDKEILALPLFISPNKRPISPNHYRNYYFRPALERAHIFNVTPHRLRHEHALIKLANIFDKAESIADRDSQIEKYARLQGWATGADMVFYYTPQIAHFLGVDSFEALQDLHEPDWTEPHSLLRPFDSTSSHPVNPLEQEIQGIMERYV